MTEHRKLMEKALREVLGTELRKRGFKGSLPHFRRVSTVRVDYLTVQFNSAGGSFVIEVVGAGPNGKPPGYGKNLPIEKLNVTYFSSRLRLGSLPHEGESDHWFAFGPKVYEANTPVADFAHFRAVALEAAAHLDSQMEPWLETVATPH